MSVNRFQNWSKGAWCEVPSPASRLTGISGLAEIQHSGNAVSRDLATDSVACGPDMVLQQSSNWPRETNSTRRSFRGGSHRSTACQVSARITLVQISFLAAG